METGRLFAHQQVQPGARRHGIGGIHGIPGIVESVSYRNQRAWQSSNPTLSANLSFFRFNHLARRSGFSRVMACKPRDLCQDLRPADRQEQA
jgi:hypothetical protein